MAHHGDDPSTYPALGRALTWLDRPGSLGVIIKALAVACAILFATSFFYTPKTYVSIEQIPGFYAFYGFFMCVFLVLTGKTLRLLLMRSEDYYGDSAVETESFPEDQLDRSPHDIEKLSARMRDLP